MSDWFTEFNGAFFITITTICVGALGVGIRACISSKCSHTDLCWGCFKVERDTKVEEEIEFGMMGDVSRRNSNVVV